jgi:cytoskeletal protein RodZ
MDRQNSSDSIQAFGRELVDARNYKGMSLEQIADITKIDVRYLKAMETGDWDMLPQPYMEAFLKAYAEAVGMNIPKVMKKYREMVQRKLAAEPPEQAAEPPEAPPQEAADSRLSRDLFKFVLLGLVVFSVAALLLIFLFNPFKESTQIEPVPVVRESETVPTEGSSHDFPADTAQTLPAAPADSAVADTQKAFSPDQIPVGIHLRARATQPCWLRAALDEKTVQDVILQPGDTLIWNAAERVELFIGNAGGLDLSMDGQALGVLGPAGRPVTIVITPEGIQSQRLGKATAVRDTLDSKRRRSP